MAQGSRHACDGSFNFPPCCSGFKGGIARGFQPANSVWPGTSGGSRKSKGQPQGKISQRQAGEFGRENWFKISELGEVNRKKKNAGRSFYFSCCCGENSVPLHPFDRSKPLRLPPAHSHRHTVCEDVRCLLGSLARPVVCCWGPRTAVVMVVIFFVLA